MMPWQKPTDVAAPVMDVTVITATATAMEDAPVDAVEDIVKKDLLPLSSRCLAL